MRLANWLRTALIQKSRNSQCLTWLLSDCQLRSLSALLSSTNFETSVYVSHKYCEVLCLSVAIYAHRNSMGVPIYEQPPPKYTATRIMQILLDPNINKSLVANGHPIEVERSSTFVVDLKHPDDVKKDMYRRLDYSGSHPEIFLCSFNQFDNVCIEKCAPGATGPNVYYLRRIRSSHPSNPNFRRLIAFVHSKFWHVKRRE